jgi:hypothetical protein
MTGIQVLLICGVLVLLLYSIFRVRNAIFDLLVYVAFAALAVYFILFPEQTNRIAHQLGVGRGADLLFYICILFFLFVILKLYARMRRLEQQLADLVRQQAKMEAKVVEEA